MTRGERRDVIGPGTKLGMFDEVEDSLELETMWRNVRWSGNMRAGRYLEVQGLRGPPSLSDILLDLGLELRPREDVGSNEREMCEAILEISKYLQNYIYLGPTFYIETSQTQDKVDASAHSYARTSQSVRS